jgi:hypothetical protein
MRNIGGETEMWLLSPLSSLLVIFLFFYASLLHIIFVNRTRFLSVAVADDNNDRDDDAIPAFTIVGRRLEGI